MRIVKSAIIVASVGIVTSAVAGAMFVQTRRTIADLAIKEIDEHYLYASDAPWKSVRNQFATFNAPNRDATYAHIASQLASIRDSELHLVNPSELAAVQRESEGERLGVGLMEFSIDLVPSSGEARIVTPLAGSPAEVSGLRPRDVIVTIDGKPTRDLDHEQVLDALRSSSEVDLLVRRGKRKFRVLLSPSEGPLEPVVTRTLPTNFGNSAYIRITQFTPAAGSDTRSAVEAFERDHVRGYILDLRNNPGGFLDIATQVAGLFAVGSLGAKVRRDGTTEPITSSATPLSQAPLVILVNEGTASAAEFVAGGLQGRKRAILVGARTYGRGQTQIYESLSDGYGLIIPSALLRTPDGRTYKGIGLRPDLQVASRIRAGDGFENTNDPQLQRAIAAISQAEKLTAPDWHRPPKSSAAFSDALATTAKCSPLKIPSGFRPTLGPIRQGQFGPNRNEPARSQIYMEVAHKQLIS